MLQRIKERITERFVNFMNNVLREDEGLDVDLEAQSPLHENKKEDNTSDKDKERSRLVEVLVV